MPADTTSAAATPHDKPALILIDIQQAFQPGVWRDQGWHPQRNNPHAEDVAAQLLQYWRQYDLPVFHVQHSSTNSNSLLHKSAKTFAFDKRVEPRGGEPVITKNVNSAFIGTTLESDLRQGGIKTVVIVGLTTNHCVSTTTRMAGNLGFNAYVVEDATATWDRQHFQRGSQMIPAQQVHEVSLANLHGEFATVVSSEQLLELVESNKL